VVGLPFSCERCLVCSTERSLFLCLQPCIGPRSAPHTWWKKRKVVAARTACCFQSPQHIYIPYHVVGVRVARVQMIDLAPSSIQFFSPLSPLYFLYFIALAVRSISAPQAQPSSAVLALISHTHTHTNTLAHTYKLLFFCWMNEDLGEFLFPVGLWVIECQWMKE
jgi:hypothetical protein